MISLHEEQWLDENSAALEAYNSFLELNGLPLHNHRLLDLLGQTCVSDEGKECPSRAQGGDGQGDPGEGRRQPRGRSGDCGV